MLAVGGIHKLLLSDRFEPSFASPEGRALQSAYNVMTFNGEKRTLRELSIFVQQKVRTIKQRS